MSTIDAVDVLEFSEKAGKRAVYEEFEFRPQGDGDVVVENKSHGDDADDHTYTVHVVGGLPSDCTCPADKYHDGACKHRVALAVRPALLDAAEAGQDEPVLADGGLPDHLTKISTLAGGSVVHCQTCGAEGGAVEAVEHHEECPETEVGE